MPRYTLTSRSKARQAVETIAYYANQGEGIIPETLLRTYHEALEAAPPSVVDEFWRAAAEKLPPNVAGRIAAMFERMPREPEKESAQPLEG